MTSTDRVEVNLANIHQALDFFKNKKVDLICFPENSLYFNFQKSVDKNAALTLDHPLWSQLGEKAKSLGAYLHLGGIPLREGEKLFNAAVVVSPQGGHQVVYRKIHLFDVNVQGREWRESASFEAGQGPFAMDVAGWKIGFSICYDLRFAELFVQYHRQNVDVILVPSSFLVPTGRAHWKTLLKARAIETQAFVVAPAQVGIHKSEIDSSLPERQTWGESLVMGPWGEELVTTLSFDQIPPEGPVNQPMLIELQRSLIQKSREQIPLLGHRKLRF